MAELKPHQVKASTLLEVIVAMVIILVIFTLAMGIYNNVLSATSYVKHQQANALMEQLVRQSITQQNWKDEETTLDSISLKKTVNPYEQYTDLVIITVTAYQQDKQIGEYARIAKKSADGH